MDSRRGIIAAGIGGTGLAFLTYGHVALSAWWANGTAAPLAVFFIISFGATLFVGALIYGKGE